MIVLSTEEGSAYLLTLMSSTSGFSDIRENRYYELSSYRTAYFKAQR